MPTFFLTELGLLFCWVVAFLVAVVYLNRTED